MMRVKLSALYVLVIVLSFLGLLWIASHYFVINVSTSMPVGLYRVISHKGAIERGDWVAVCLSGKVAHEGLKQGFLWQSNQCSTGVIPIIKEVIAVPQDSVWLGHGNMCVNGHCVSAMRFKQDDQGHPVRTFVKAGRHTATGYWLYGLGSTKSWDSRYFGSVQKTAIMECLLPVMIFMNT